MAHGRLEPRLLKDSRWHQEAMHREHGRKRLVALILMDGMKHLAATRLLVGDMKHREEGGRPTDGRWLLAANATLKGDMRLLVVDAILRGGSWHRVANSGGVGNCLTEGYCCYALV